MATNDTTKRYLLKWISALPGDDGQCLVAAPSREAAILKWLDDTLSLAEREGLFNHRAWQSCRTYPVEGLLHG